MTRILLALITLSMGFLACQPTTPPEIPISYATAPDDDELTLPDGFDVVVVADSLGRARHLTVRENGDVFVHLRGKTTGGNSIVALRDTTKDGIADVTKDFGPYAGTGIEIFQNHLYYSTKDRIFRQGFTEDELIPSGPMDTIVRLDSGTEGHSEKTFAINDRGEMFVNVGSYSNACQEEKRTKGSKGVDPCIELETRAGIWKFSATELGQEQTLDRRYATGIRNAVAITWDENTQSLYAMQHGRDDLHRFWPDLFTEEQNVELPSEEFLQVSEGDDFGWPYCYYDHTQQKRFLNPEYGGDGMKVERCSEAKSPLLGFPGHWGPNDILIYRGSHFPEKYHQGAFIAFHGSWNRLGHSQAGYKVVFVPMANGKVTGDYEVFVDGFAGTDSIEAPGAATYRPCGLAEGPDGTLYICDSAKGRIWRVVHNPSI